MGKRAVNLQLSGDVASQANSWGEYLQQYKDGRQYDTGVQVVPRARTDGSSKAKEATRSFNPITQSDIDPVVSVLLGLLPLALHAPLLAGACFA